MKRFGITGLLGVIVMLASWSVQADDKIDLSSFKRPASIPFPSDNPYGADKAALGKALYFDPRVSGNGNMNCMTCHNPSFAFSDGQVKAVGAQAKSLPRHSPTILNEAWGEKFFWDGRADSLEAQATGPITAPMEMNMPLNNLVARLKEIDGYQKWFDRVFPGQGITEKTIPMAIATFERTLVSGRAPFDKWVEGDDKAVSESAKNGFRIFTGKAACVTCHTGWAFTDHGFHDVGLPDDDLGRGKLVPGDSSLVHAFKTPSLRNVRQRAPYLHDGSIPDIEILISHYEVGGVSRPSNSLRPFQLSDQERKDLIAFLDTLNAEEVPVVLPILPR